MANKDLFKQAIAEAKSVREAAIANAKEALEETLTPHLKDMLAAKLQEMEDSQNEEEVVNEVEEEEVEEGNYSKDKKEEAVEENTSGFTSVEEAEEEEAEDDSEESEDEAEEEAGEEAGEEKEAEEGEEEIDGDEDLSKLSVDQFKDMIRDIISQEVGGEAEMGADMDAGDIEGMGDEAPMEEPGMEAEPEMGAEDEEEIDLDELLRELEATNEGDYSKEEEVSEESVEELAGGGVDALTAIIGAGGLTGGAIALSKLMDALEAGKLGSKGEAVAKFLRDAGSTFKDQGAPMKEEEEVEESVELDEALETIESLRKDLQEVNLLNSKLLYVNKIFKANNLTESQKVNIIAAFDKAETVKEVKLVFETVSENVVATKKETVTESKFKGMASKATGTTASKPEVIAEVSDAVKRMQKLAGIIK